MVNEQDARRLLVMSREARWAFPSSSGRPVPSEEPAWVAHLSAHRTRFMEAITFFNAHGEHDAAAEIAANVWRLWVVAGDDKGGRAFLAPVLTPPVASMSRHRALALYGDGLLAFRLGDLDASRAQNSAALAVARAINDPEAEGLALLGLSRVELSAHRYPQARELAAASRARMRQLDPSFEQAPLHMLAQATRLAGTLDEASALFEESLALNRRLGDHGMVVVELHNLGHVELRRGHVDVAEKLFAECAQPLDVDDAYGGAMTLFNQAAIALARNDRARAASLMDEARGMLRRTGTELAADDAQEFDRLAQSLSAGHGD